ncbi:MAG: HEAT repeat domain-containing protein, partial [candidate division WOR-3 bacterium]
MRFRAEVGIAESLAQLLADPCQEVRLTVVGALGALARAGCGGQNELVRCLDARDPDVRGAAVLVLAADTAAESKVARVLSDPAARTRARIAAAEVLGRMRGPQSFSVLSQMLAVRDDSLLEAVIRLLPWFGESLAIRPLLVCLRREQVRTRVVVAQALGELRSPESASALIQLLGAREPELVAAAVRAVARLRDTAAIRPLVRILASRPELDPAAVNRALILLGPVASPAVADLLRSEDDELRVRVIGILGRTDGDSAVRALVQALPDWRCGPAAAQALAGLGWEPEGPADKIHYEIARRAGRHLTIHSEELTRVLREDIRSEIRRVRENAIYAAVALGATHLVDDLAAAIARQGSRSLAECFINSGHPKLIAAGEDWARRHGYFAVAGQTSSDVRWGDWTSQ